MSEDSHLCGPNLSIHGVVQGAGKKILPLSIFWFLFLQTPLIHLFYIAWFSPIAKYVVIIILRKGKGGGIRFAE